MTTTKKEIVRGVAEKLGEEQGKVSLVLEGVLDEICSALAARNRIEIRGFGVFSVARRKARLARNPKTGEPVQVPERAVVRFKPGRRLKERVSQSG